MAKLSVYNTIDRSQLGGKFVPLIQSGVSNYKILASDLGKEYHPGDAIEITDTGEINVKFHPGEFEIVNSYLSINPDDSRGVFNGSNGLYIASADDTINVSSSGIKVNPEALAGPGLHYHYDKSLKVFAIPPLSVTNNGIELNLGDGGGLKVHDNALWIDKDYISQYATVRVGHGLYWYRPGYPESALYVQSANSSILVEESGLSVHAYALIDNDYLSITPSHVITVDTASVARAITGSGLVTTNGAIGVNVNTATGIIVKDNRLYLNAGYGLHTTNNTVRVKKADDTIDLSSSGIKVNAGYGLSATEYGLRVKSADSSIDVSSDGIRVNIEPDGGLRSGGLGLYIDSSVIPTATSLAGTGLGYYDNDTKLYIKSADNTIGVSSHGIKVNTYYLAGHGLSATNHGLYVQPADGFIKSGSGGVWLHYHNLLSSLTNEYGGSANIKIEGSYLYTAIGDGLRLGSNKAIYVKSANSTIDVSSSGISVNPGYSLSSTSVGLEVSPSNDTLIVNSGGVSVNTSYLAGHGLSSVSNSLEVKPADNTIYVSSAGISVNKSALSIPTASSLVGSGLTSRGSYLYVQSADGSIGVGVGGIKVNAASGLETTPNGLYVKSADDTIYVSSAGIKVNTLEPLVGLGLEWSGAQALYVKSADSTIDVIDSGIKVNPAALAHTLPGKGLYSDNGKISIHVDTAGLGITDSGSIYWNKPDPGWGLESGESGTYYVKSADGTIGVTSSGIGVNVTSGGGLLTGANGLYIDSGKIAGRGLTAHTEQHNVKLNVNVGQYDLSSNNRSSNLLKIDTATNALYVRGVDVTGIIGTNNTMTRQQDPTSHYHSFGVDVDYLFSTYTDRSTLVYSGNKLSVHLASIAGENIGYDPMSKSLYVSSGGSGGSIVGVDVDTPNGYGTQASGGGVAIGESAHANGGNSVAVGRLSNAHGTQSVAIGYFSSAGNFKSIAIGNSAVSTGHSSISIGAASSAHYARGIAVGQEAAVYEEGGISIGGFSGAGSGISIGLSSYTQSGIAVGSEAAAGGSASVAIGNNAYVAHASLGGIAIGYGAQAFTASNLAIGYQAQAHSFATVLGSFATAGAMSVCSGYKASATNEGSVVIGAGAVSSNQYALSAGYDSSANGEMSVAVGTHSIAAGYGCLALGAFSNSSTYGGVSIGYKSRSLGGIAIGYESSASDGMMSLTVYHSSGRRFNYSYGCDGYLYSMYSNSTSSGTYTRSWDNLLTPPNYSTAVSINTNTEYTADRPAYIAFNVYAGGTSGYEVAFLKNRVTVFNIGILYGLTVYNIIPVSKGDTYKLQVTDHGATNPQIYAYRIYPQ